MAAEIYAGIGSRETPSEALGLMTRLANELTGVGWQLRTGAAHGADTAFENGAHPQLREIHLPWNGYNNRYIERDACCIVPEQTPKIEHIAATHHPAWLKLSPAVRSFMCRNVTIVLGADLKSPAKMVICWTPGAKLVGGTSHAMKVAHAHGIPTFNLASENDIQNLIKFGEQC